MLYGIIMAGGSGTRLWPESRKNFPKQLMTLSGHRSFLQSTVDRLQPLCAPENIVVVTGKSLARAVRDQLPELSADSVIVEPCARNTSGCIALAALWCLRRDPEAVMVLLPADHMIQPVCEFQKTISRAASLVEEYPDKLVTLGIVPTYPAESFGYVERGEEFGIGVKGDSGERLPDGIQPFEVVRFREKPERSVAEEYLASGNFYWNSGIFVWKAKTILENLRRFAPGVYGPVEKLLQVQSNGNAEFETVLEREFPQMESISIDYAVMEPASAEGSILLLPAPFSWDDVGSWRSMERLFPQDSSGNTLASASGTRPPVLVDTAECTIRNTDPQKTVACFGVKDLAVIVTPDVVLIFDRNREESVREVTKKLKEMNCEELL
ncbi:MAG: mannose-1-phosphate guanylyltransferase [Planctomycetia bacterium]|nr:mannose-1-phosphate guanylyltransferase [Planctomycetia bacterium]